MSIISPARIGAGFAVATAFAFPMIITVLPDHKPPTVSIALASASAAAMPTEVPDPYREDRLLPDEPSTDDSNGCGMQKNVDVCALDFVTQHFPQYIR